MIMKKIQYIAGMAIASLFVTGFSGCSEKDEAFSNDEGIAIDGIAATLEGMNGEANVSTRATKSGFSVNTDKDPTKASLETRGRNNWKMDFTLYNNGTKYDAGSFTDATYDNTYKYWSQNIQKYFPNYKKPQAEVYIYPTSKDATIAEDQSSTLLVQDILIKEKGSIDVAHTPTITVKHKCSMLDFVIKDVVRTDISEVKVLVGSTTYTPYRVTTETTGTGNIEYMLILPETTGTNPVVQITTGAGTAQFITYKQTINIIQGNTKQLGSNNCYCFTLQGAELKISPVTVLNWTTGESLPGEYIAVTAYPTFKAEGHANETFYFYYDNKLTENGKAKLQKITFNKNAECTIKPDGRIITYISKVDNLNDSNDYITCSIVLGKMVIDLKSTIEDLTKR